MHFVLALSGPIFLISVTANVKLFLVVASPPPIRKSEPLAARIAWVKCKLT